MTDIPNTAPVHNESNYQLLIRSEEIERGLLEGIVYLLLAIATITSIWQFSRQPVTFTDLGSSIPQTVVAVQTSTFHI